MAKKMIRFTDKRTGNVTEFIIDFLGRKVFDITKSVDEMNATVRWCNHNDVGGMLENDMFKVEITSIV